MSQLSRLLLAGAAGALVAGAFPPFDLPWPVILLGVAGWFLLTTKGGVGPSLAFAFGFHIVLLRWLNAVGWDAWLALAVLEAFFFLPVALLRHFTHRWWWSLPVIALAWPGSDWLRDHAGALAFGWGQLAFATVDAPWSELAPFVSQWSMTGFIVLIGGLIARVCSRGRAGSIAALGAVILALTLPLLIAPSVQPAPGGARISLVQGGVDHTGIGAVGDRRAVMRRHAVITVARVRQSDLVLWPENSVDVDPYRDALAAQTLRDTARSIGVPILVGALLESPEGRRNASVLVTADAMRTLYVKQRLVPFGEVLPARQLLTRFIARTTHIPIDFVPGNASGRLQQAGARLGIVICFEIADEGIVEAAAAGAQALVVQTNNATYAGLGQSEQQLRIAQYRAKSLRIPVYVVSTNGPTAEIDMNGAILQRLDEGAVGVLRLQPPRG